MILYDINSFPPYLDIGIWRELIDKGIVLFDSNKGAGTICVDGDIALVDINEISKEQEIIIAGTINEMNEKAQAQSKEERSIIDQNNAKLVRYLQSLNRGEDPNEAINPI